MVLVSGQVFSGLGQVFLVLVQVFKFHRTGVSS